MTYRRKLAAVGLALVLGVSLLAGCTSSSGEPEAAAIPQETVATEDEPEFAATTLEAATERGPYGVGVTTVELVDASRPTEANGDFPGADERRFVVDVWYPAATTAAAPEAEDAALDSGGAPYPLIVFAHGLSSFRRQSASYTQHLASHGYVVVSPDFPSSNLTSPGGPRLGAVVDQPGDVSFLIDRFLAFSEEAGHLLEGAVDGETIGLTGHSLGGLTTLLTIYGPSRDERVDAALPIAAPACFFAEEAGAGVSVPVLVLGGSQDLIVNPASIRQGYEVASPPRYFVELAGADHVRFADLDITDTELPGIVADVAGGEDTFTGDALRVAEAAGGDIVRCGDRPDLADDPLLSAERQRELLRIFATPFFDAYLRGSDDARSFLEDELPESVANEVRFEYEAP